MLVYDIKKDFTSLSSQEKKDVYARFFKTSKGDYGYGDVFIGLTTPQIKSLLKKYGKEISIKDTLLFLQDPIHEYRMFALQVLKNKFHKGDKKIRKEIYNIYLDNIKYINNWDLVDVSCHYIVGQYLLDKDRDILYELAKSDDLWAQRISIVSTFAFIRNDDFKDTLVISKILLDHEHDLIHKAVGWMLREVWKRDSNIVEKFLKDNYNDIPRTTLRYAIERVPESKRRRFLRGDFTR